MTNRETILPPDVVEEARVVISGLDPAVRVIDLSCFRRKEHCNPPEEWMDFVDGLEPPIQNILTGLLKPVHRINSKMTLETARGLSVDDLRKQRGLRSLERAQLAHDIFTPADVENF